MTIAIPAWPTWWRSPLILPSKPAWMSWTPRWPGAARQSGGCACNCASSSGFPACTDNQCGGACTSFSSTMTINIAASLPSDGTYLLNVSTHTSTACAWTGTAVDSTSLTLQAFNVGTGNVYQINNGPGYAWSNGIGGPIGPVCCGSVSYLNPVYLSPTSGTPGQASFWTS